MAHDIAPTADGVYWIANNYTDGPSPTTPFRYVPSSGRIIRGPSTRGTVGSPAITDTGGWVWMVVGVGDDVVVEQLDITTLTLHSRQYLPVKNNLFGGGVDPDLTATINGPLGRGWQRHRELNPSTGAAEAEFDTGSVITSMSTDPTGSLLYTDSEDNQSEPWVTEYSARTGKEIKRAYPGGIVAGSVAATDGGVWVSFRTGMGGQAIGLSAIGLTQIAPPLNPRSSTFDPYGQDGGVGASVSQETLWLTALTDNGVLTCADPVTGAVRAQESVIVTDSIARSPLLYAFHNDYLVSITPINEMLRVIRANELTALCLVALLHG